MASQLLNQLDYSVKFTAGNYNEHKSCYQQWKQSAAQAQSQLYCNTLEIEEIIEAARIGASEVATHASPPSLTHSLPNESFSVTPGHSITGGE